MALAAGNPVRDMARCSMLNTAVMSNVKFYTGPPGNIDLRLLTYIQRKKTKFFDACRWGMRRAMHWTVSTFWKFWRFS